MANLTTFSEGIFLLLNPNVKVVAENTREVCVINNGKCHCNWLQIFLLHLLSLTVSLWSMQGGKEKALFYPIDVIHCSRKQVFSLTNSFGTVGNACFTPHTFMSRLAKICYSRLIEEFRTSSTWPTAQGS